MTADVKGMSVLEYLGQGEFWIDTKANTVFAVAQMDPDRRLRAARDLARMSTALIITAEGEAASRRDLAEVLRLAGRSPRVWMSQTELYRALYPEPVGEVTGNPVVSSGNQINDLGVIQTYGALRSA